MKLVMQFDGASRGNPGLAGAGVYIFHDIERKSQTWSLTEYVGPKSTNNQAEYASIILGLDKLIKLVAESDWDISEIIIQGDSQLAIRQLKGQYKVKSPKLIPLFSKALKLLDELKAKVPKISITHIYRENNKNADRLANQAIDERFGER